MNQDQTQNLIKFVDNNENLEIQVHLKDETVWLTQAQMAILFEKNLRTINDHIRNIYLEGELSENPTIRKFRIVQKEGSRNIPREVLHYNLDVIISVGYRVKSKRGTQFRIWANKILKDYILKGYTINQDRLNAIKGGVQDLYSVIEQIKTINRKAELPADEKQTFVDLILEYSESLNLLRMFDEGELITPKSLTPNKFDLSYDSALVEINSLRTQLEAGDIFGSEKDDGFKSAIANIYQTYDGKELYQSAEIKAANLLYLIIKNHPFSDGNKRIGAYFFVRFLDANKLLRKSSGEKVISENTLVALAIMVAQSDRTLKEQVINLVVNLLKS